MIGKIWIHGVIMMEVSGVSKVTLMLWVKANTGGKGGKKRGYNCGQPGHSAKFCPNPPKGKSKGKGWDNRDCYVCGQKGHIAAFCPQNPKGKGKGYKGKGVNGLDDQQW